MVGTIFKLNKFNYLFRGASSQVGIGLLACLVTWVQPSFATEKKVYTQNVYDQYIRVTYGSDHLIYFHVCKTAKPDDCRNLKGFNSDESDPHGYDKEELARASETLSKKGTRNSFLILPQIIGFSLLGQSIGAGIMHPDSWLAALNGADPTDLVLLPFLGGMYLIGKAMSGRPLSRASIIVMGLGGLSGAAYGTYRSFFSKSFSPAIKMSLSEILSPQFAQVTGDYEVSRMNFSELEGQLVNELKKVREKAEAISE